MFAQTLAENRKRYKENVQTKQITEEHLLTAQTQHYAIISYRNLMKLKCFVMKAYTGRTMRGDSL